jgi:polysaccharide export outer membrane protein
VKRSTLLLVHDFTVGQIGTTSNAWMLGRTWLLVLACAGIVACSAARPPTAVSSSASMDSSAAPANQERVHALLTARQQRSDPDSEYAVAPGDLLAVTIYNFRPGGGVFESEVRVDDRGYVSLPTIDPVRAAGLTLAQLRAALVTRLQEARVLPQPLISVFLKEYQGQRVIVLGAVARPGQYNLSRGRQTLVDVLSMAGGLTERTGNYVLFRPAPSGTVPGGEDTLMHGYALKSAATTDALVDPQEDAVVFRLGGASSGTTPSALLLPVRGGDLFIIPEAGQAFVEGEVEKPGPYALSRDMTLMQLIASAGGLAFPADRRRVTLLRAEGRGKSTPREIDVEQIQSQEQPDVLLEPNDRIVVPATAGRKVAYGVYRTFTALVHFTVGGVASVF